MTCCRSAVRISDVHAPSAKLRDGLDLAQLLVESEIPGITRLRAEKLVAALPGAQAVLDAEHGQFVNAGLPDDTARALAEWLDADGHGAMLLAAENAMREIPPRRRRWPRSWRVRWMGRPWC